MHCVAKCSTPVPKYARHCAHEVKQCQIVLLRCRAMAVRKRRKPETTTPPPPPPTLTTHQIVAYNFARARAAAGWTQVETSDRLEPYLGYKLNQAGVSAIEKTYDSERRRNIDTADVVAFSRCFRRPIGWFFLPPPGRGGDLVEPVNDDRRYHLPAADLVALAIGTPSGLARLPRSHRRAAQDRPRAHRRRPPLRPRGPPQHHRGRGPDQPAPPRDPRHHALPATRRRRRGHHPDGAAARPTRQADTPRHGQPPRHRPRPRPRAPPRRRRPSAPRRTAMAQRYRDAGIPRSSPFDDVDEIDLEAVIKRDARIGGLTVRGSVVQKGGRWYVKIELDPDPLTGRRRMKWHSGYRTKKDAERARTDLLSKLDRGEYVEPSHHTVGDFLLEWLDTMEPTVRPSTFESYSRNVHNHVIAHIGAPAAAQGRRRHAERPLRAAAPLRPSCAVTIRPGLLERRPRPGDRAPGRRADARRDRRAAARRVRRVRPHHEGHVGVAAPAERRRRPAGGDPGGSRSAHRELRPHDPAPCLQGRGAVGPAGSQPGRRRRPAAGRTEGGEHPGVGCRDPAVVPGAVADRRTTGCTRCGSCWRRPACAAARPSACAGPT